MKNLIKGFKEFALRGNVIDLAIGIIVGAGFNTVVQSLVKNIVLPPIGLVLNRVDFTSLYIPLTGSRFPTLADAQKAGEPVLAYGLFFNDLISFLITALVVFFIVRWINRLHKLRKQGKEESPTTKECPFCFTTIPIKAIRCPQCTSQLS
ncbi:MAG: large conductance mechanosensitive channel protein MscL [bacterium]|nr:large conductance mechanosensitive channel protein MscL [bacterium]